MGSACFHYGDLWDLDVLVMYERSMQEAKAEAKLQETNI